MGSRLRFLLYDKLSSIITIKKSCSHLCKYEQTKADYTNFKKGFENVKEASMNIFNEANTILNQLKKGGKEANTAMTTIKTNDYFMKKASEFMKKSDSEIERTAKKYEKVEKECKSLIKNYGYEEKDVKYTKIEEFFKLISNFLDDLDRSMPKEEIKKVYNRKHEVGTKVDSNMNNIINQPKTSQVQLKKK